MHDWTKEFITSLVLTQMKLILSLTALVAILFLQAGCSTGASVGHDGHRHGVGLHGSTAGPGVSAGARAY